MVRRPSVTGLDDGGFFVSWSFQEDLGNPYSDDVEIHGKRFDSNGNSVALPNDFTSSYYNTRFSYQRRHCK